MTDTAVDSPAVPVPAVHSPVVTAHKESTGRRRPAADRRRDHLVRRVDEFVYIHAVIFAVWMLFIERNPWPKLTLIVSLEAIFLSTFVMIGQNRQAAFQQAKADHDFVEQEQELKTNTELTNAIHAAHQGDPRARDVSGLARVSVCLLDQQVSSPRCISRCDVAGRISSTPIGQVRQMLDLGERGGCAVRRASVLSVHGTLARAVEVGRW